MDIADSGKVGIKKILNFIKTYMNVIQSLIRNPPDLCYFALTTTGAAFYKDFLLVGLIKLFRVKLIYHLHNKGVSRNSSSKIVRIFYRNIFRNVDVILLSKRLYPDIMQYVPETKIFICPNGICDERNLCMTQNVNSHYKNVRKKSVINILFLSNLLESKGIFILMEALAILKQKGIQFRCNIAGSEGDITASRLLDRKENLNLSNEVNYLGKLYGEEKHQLYAESDIFVFPTYYPNETFGLVLLEAMSHSLPIISTPEGGIPEVVLDGINGFLVSQRNVVQLANKLELLIKDDKLRLKMGLAGRRKFEKEFTLERFENKLADILRKAI